MANPKNNERRIETTGATVGYDAELWLMADPLRGWVNAAEYKHVVLDSIFLNYVSDAFEEHRRRLLNELDADAEDFYDCRGGNIFWIPLEVRWKRLRENVREPFICDVVDQAVEAIEGDDPSLEGVLSKGYAFHPPWTNSASANSST